MTKTIEFSDGFKPSVTLTREEAEAQVTKNRTLLNMALRNAKKACADLGVELQIRQLTRLTSHTHQGRRLEATMTPDGTCYLRTYHADDVNGFHRVVCWIPA